MGCVRRGDEYIIYESFREFGTLGSSDDTIAKKQMVATGGKPIRG